MEARAEARYIRSSPQKTRLVVDLIRGRSANEARIILRQTNKRMAPTVLKVLDSAIANAENRNNDVDVDELVVSEAYVNEGPRQKRIRPAPMGRAYRYQRRTSHIAVVVSDKKGAETVTEENASWDRKYIHTAFVWASPKPGDRAGSPRQITPSF
jgi:large subunit ribosomal protein L22